VGLNVGCASVAVIDLGDAEKDFEGFVKTQLKPKEIKE